MILNRKKEIYFSNDIFKAVSDKIKVPEFLVKDVFMNYISDLKEYILETDDLYYSVNPLGVLSINKVDLDKSLKRLQKRYYKETDPLEKEKLSRYIKNFKTRQKRILVEEEKFKSVYPDEFHPYFLKKEANSLLKPSKVNSKYYNNGVSLKVAERAQNEYAYKYYNKFKKPLNH